ncbi:MAG: cupin domain-containing protein [Ectothiorhodospiraceae bacterium]|nr:cupin domain-containing protein [Chromatiales bacterium]MCP5155034.1 cupin domain-containing protein [Ectothiorhodospiraceae bacterium]
MKQATSTVQVDNDRVRVTEWRFPPGSATGHHRHEYDYVVVPTVGGTLTIVANDGTETASPIVASQAYFRRAGVEHDVRNLTAAEIVFVEIESKP